MRITATYRRVLYLSIALDRFPVTHPDAAFSPVEMTATEK